MLPLTNEVHITIYDSNTHMSVTHMTRRRLSHIKKRAIVSDSQNVNGLNCIDQICVYHKLDTRFCVFETKYREKKSQMKVISNHF